MLDEEGQAKEDRRAVRAKRHDRGGDYCREYCTVLTCRPMSWPEALYHVHRETQSNRKAESLNEAPALVIYDYACASASAFAFPVKLETAIAWEHRCTATLRIIYPFTTDHPPVDNRFSLPSFITLFFPTLHSFDNLASLSRPTHTCNEYEPLIRRPRHLFNGSFLPTPALATR